jgi:hypothetical protein
MSPRSPLPGRDAARWPVLAGDERADLLGIVAEDSPAGPGGGTVLVAVLNRQHLRCDAAGTPRYDRWL